MAKLNEYGKFLRAGYTWRELSMNFFRLMVWSRLTSALKHSFAERGRGVVIDYTACIQGSRFISIGDHSWLQRHVWLTVPLIEMEAAPKGPILKLGRRVQVGPRCTFSAVRGVELEDDVLVGPNVYIADHIHAYKDAGTPVKDQGLAQLGTVRVGKGAWIGTNCVIVANGQDLIIGEGAVISANSVVTKSVPARCVAAGSPVRVADRYDAALGRWTRDGLS